MVNKNELRINNYVRIKDYFLCVKAIGEKVSLGNNATSEFVHDDFEYSKIQGIPLTPEILKNVGFVGFTKRPHERLKEVSNYIDVDDEYTIAVEVITDIGEHAVTIIYSDFDEPKDSVSVGWRPKYLHELQNIYFALTNLELEIDL